VIVVDASVAVKWAVEEPGRADALRILELNEELVAPDLIFAELANVLRKKIKSGEVVAEQGTRTLDGVRLALSKTVASAELWADALQLALILDHSAYDCFYLTMAIGRSALVSADGKFVSKCRDNGLGAFVFEPAELVAAGRRADQEVAVPASIFPDVQRLGALVEKTFETLRDTAAVRSDRGGLRLIPSRAYAPAFDSPAYRKLVKILRQLSPEHLGFLVALGWLGRPYHALESWPTLPANAERMAAEGLELHERYFVAQMGRVADGLRKLRSAQGSMQPNE
jgi:predicted nucleic acid-binding protein